jgi:hypothetical protein
VTRRSNSGILVAFGLPSIRTVLGLYLASVSRKTGSVSNYPLPLEAKALTYQNRRMYGRFPWKHVSGAT